MNHDSSISSDTSIPEEQNEEGEGSFQLATSASHLSHHEQQPAQGQEQEKLKNPSLPKSPADKFVRLTSVLTFGQ